MMNSFHQAVMHPKLHKSQYQPGTKCLLTCGCKEKIMRITHLLLGQVWYNRLEKSTTAGQSHKTPSTFNVFYLTPASALLSFTAATKKKKISVKAFLMHTGLFCLLVKSYSPL